MNLKDPIIKRAFDIREELSDIRKRFHSDPELSFNEQRTAGYIADYLKALGLEVTTGIAGTGITALLRGGLEGDTTALRADMDALPIRIGKEPEYAIHACGHDGHMAILLGAAKLLSENRNMLRGTVKFIFQPAEETSAGAKQMISEGVLSDPPVARILGLHILPDIKSGSIEVRKGALLASTDGFHINIKGKGGHGSNPQNTIDPIITGAHLVTALQCIISRKINPLNPAVLSVCQFIAGTRSNIIPAEAYLSGTIRCFDSDLRKYIIEEIEKISDAVCQITGADHTLTVNSLVPVTMNDSGLFDDFITVSQSILDPEELIIPEKPYMYGEDFSFFGEEVPALFFLLGTYNVEKGCIHAPHSPEFDIDEDILPLGAALFVNYCLNRRQE